MATTSAAPGLRSDTLRNRKLIIRSAGRLFAEGRQATMADIARAAEVSTATAYRHFASVDEVLARFRFDVGSELLEFSQQQQATGLELLRLVSSKWVTLVVAHGRAMVHTRSGEGYLARLRTGATHLTVQADALSSKAAAFDRIRGNGFMGGISGKLPSHDDVRGHHKFGAGIGRALQVVLDHRDLVFLQQA